MKKHSMKRILFSVLSTGLLLSGCGNTDDAPKIPEETTIEAATAETVITDSSVFSTETIENTDVSQGGPYGKISLSIPDGWHYETCPIDSEQLVHGMYGIHFYPGNAANGYIELAYIDNFGVCGTGLDEKIATIAGQQAYIGTYDNHNYWDFISFKEDYDGIVALTYSVEDWWDTYSDQIMEILNTLSFDSSIKEGGAYIQNNDSELEQIGLFLTLKKISPTGTTLIFHLFDANAPTGQLIYGDDFAIEVQKDGVWEEAPITLEGEYGFHDIGYTITAEGSSEQELNWAWLYGALSPGTYRIKKSILDSRAPGDYDKYTIYAQFVLN